MTYKIALINMPFGALETPSLALTQLRTVIQETFKDRVCVEIFYLNHEFYHWLDHPDFYQYALSMDGLVSGVGDWFFSSAAFPDQADNTAPYFRRYHPVPDSQTERLRQIIKTGRENIDKFSSHAIDKYQLNQFNLVGFTSLFSQQSASLAMARKLKAYTPSPMTLIGGPACEGVMGQTWACQMDCLDFVFSGPALKSFPQFVQFHLSGKKDELHSIPGVFSKQNSRDILKQTAHEVLSHQQISSQKLTGDPHDINSVIELDYDSFLTSFEHHFPAGEKEPELFFETSRGCWWGQGGQCTFCGLNGLNLGFTQMAPEKAVDYIGSLFRYLPRCRQFSAVDNILPKTYIRKVFPRLATPIEANIFYETRSDLRENDLRVLARANVKTLQPGVEALNTDTLSLMKKGVDAIQNIQFLKHCLVCDISPLWNLLVGLPGETLTSYEQYITVIPSIVHLPPPTGVFPVRFDRHSQYFRESGQYGLELRPYDFYGLTYPFDEKALTNIAYFFFDYNGSADYQLWMSKWLPILAKLCKNWQETWEKLPPRLYLKKKNDVALVYDSRFGTPREYELNSPELQILTFLAIPAKSDTLEKSFTQISPQLISRTISNLEELNFIYRDPPPRDGNHKNETQLVSLVLPDAFPEEHP